MSITAKFAGTCNVCCKPIRAGEKIEWKKGAGSTHLACVGKTPEPLNSPPPLEMIAADADLGALAAQHGRTIDGEAKLVSFYGQGDKPGDIMRSKGNRYLVLAVGPANYYSRDFLEDMDMFHMKPGRYSDVQAVRVQPTAEEAAKDNEATTRKQETEQLAAALQNSYSADTHLSQEPQGIGLTVIWSESRLAGSENWYLGSDGIVYHMRSDYDMGPSWWRTTATEAQIARAKELGMKVFPGR